LKKRKKQPAGTDKPRAGGNANDRHIHTTRGELCQYRRAELLKRGRYLGVPEEILYDPDLTAPEKLTWIALALHQRDNLTSWPSTKRLAHLTRLSRITVIRTVKSLEAKKYLKVTRRPGTTSLYQLFFRSEPNHSQSGITMIPLSRKARPEDDHSESGITEIQGVYHSDTGVVSQRYTETEEVKQKKEEKKNKGDANASLVSESEKSEKLPTKGNGENPRFRQLAENLLDDLNTWGEKRWPASDANLRPIIDRLKQGYSFPELKAAVLHCAGIWKGTKFERNLRPSVIFGRNLDRYISEGAAIVELSECLKRAQEEVERLEREGIALKQRGASEEELEKLRERYRAAKERCEAARDELFRHLECQYPSVYVIEPEKVDGDGPWG